MNSKLKLPLLVMLILLIQSCSGILGGMEQAAACSGGEWNSSACREAKKNTAERNNQRRRCQREPPEWQNCKARERAGDNVYCGVKPC